MTVQEIRAFEQWQAQQPIRADEKHLTWWQKTQLDILRWQNELMNQKRQAQADINQASTTESNPDAERAQRIFDKVMALSV